VRIRRVAAAVVKNIAREHNNAAFGYGERHTRVVAVITHQIIAQLVFYVFHDVS